MHRTSDAMPLTAFHAGPGLLVKAVAPHAFSFKLFLATQIALDLEPGVRMLLGHAELHGWTHTWPGSLVVCGVAAAVWRSLAGHDLRYFTIDRLSLPVLVFTALFGAWSHVLLDGLVHADMTRTAALLIGTRVSVTPLAEAERWCLILAGAALPLWYARRGLGGVGADLLAGWRAISGRQPLAQQSTPSRSRGVVRVLKVLEFPPRAFSGLLGVLIALAVALIAASGVTVTRRAFDAAQWRAQPDCGSASLRGEQARVEMLAGTIEWLRTQRPTADAVERALGPPSHRSEREWHYCVGWIPPEPTAAQLSITFGQDGRVASAGRSLS